MSSLQCLIAAAQPLPEEFEFGSLTGSSVDAGSTASQCDECVRFQTVGTRSHPLVLDFVAAVVRETQIHGLPVLAQQHCRGTKRSLAHGFPSASNGMHLFFKWSITSVCHFIRGWSSCFVTVVARFTSQRLLPMLVMLELLEA